MHSKKSTSNYSSSSMRHHDEANLLNFDLFDPGHSKNSTDSLLNTHSEDDSLGKNHVEQQNFSADDEDPFGFGLDQIQSHRNKLISMSTLKDGEMNR